MPGDDTQTMERKTRGAELALAPGDAGDFAIPLPFQNRWRQPSELNL